MTELAGDIEPTIKNWLINLVGAGVHVCYALPRDWDLTVPAVTVVLLDEGYTDIPPVGDVLMQFDCWAAPRKKDVAATVKATVLTGLYTLETTKWVDAVTGNMISAAYNTHALWAPDLTTTTAAGLAAPTPRYTITTQLVTGKAPALI